MVRFVLILLLVVGRSFGIFFELLDSSSNSSSSSSSSSSESDEDVFGMLFRPPLKPSRPILPQIPVTPPPIQESKITCGPPLTCPETNCLYDPAVVHGYCCGCQLRPDLEPYLCPPYTPCPIDTSELCRQGKYIIECCCDRSQDSEMDNWPALLINMTQSSESESESETEENEISLEIITEDASDEDEINGTETTTTQTTPYYPIFMTFPPPPASPPAFIPIYESPEE